MNLENTKICVHNTKINKIFERLIALGVKKEALSFHLKQDEIGFLYIGNNHHVACDRIGDFEAFEEITDFKEITLTDLFSRAKPIENRKVICISCVSSFPDPHRRVYTATEIFEDGSEGVSTIRESDSIDYLCDLAEDLMVPFVYGDRRQLDEVLRMLSKKYKREEDGDV